MSGLIPQRFVEDLLDRIDLAELIGSRMTLKKKPEPTTKPAARSMMRKHPHSTFGQTKAFTIALAAVPMVMPSASFGNSTGWALLRPSKSWQNEPAWKCPMIRQPDRKSSRPEH
jgi:hypothetical protein